MIKKENELESVEGIKVFYIGKRRAEIKEVRELGRKEAK